MDVATNIEVNMSVYEDGVWSASWAWKYSEDEPSIIEYEDLLIEDAQGLFYARAKGSKHSANTGETCLGNSQGSGKMRPGDNMWHVIIYSENNEILGDRKGNFFAMIPIEQ